MRIKRDGTPLGEYFIQENSRQLKPSAGLTPQKQINASRAYQEFSSLALLSWYVF